MSNSSDDEILVSLSSPLCTLVAEKLIPRFNDCSERNTLLNRDQSSVSSTSPSPVLSYNDEEAVFVGELYQDAITAFNVVIRSLSGHSWSIDESVEQKIEVFHSTETQVFSRPGAKSSMAVKSYGAFGFKKLRELLGIQDEDFQFEFSFPQPSWCGVGIHSTSGLFLLREIPKKEAKALFRLLLPYYEHVRAHPHTLLCRFLDLHRVDTDGGKHYFVVERIHTSYKLYRFADKRLLLNGTSRYNMPTHRSTPMWDLNWKSEFFIDEQDKKKVREAALCDLEFLCKNGCVKYELSVSIGSSCIFDCNDVTLPDYVLQRMKERRSQISGVSEDSRTNSEKASGSESNSVHLEPSTIKPAASAGLVEEAAAAKTSNAESSGSFENSKESNQARTELSEPESDNAEAQEKDHRSSLDEGKPKKSGPRRSNTVTRLPMTFKELSKKHVKSRSSTDITANQPTRKEKANSFFNPEKKRRYQIIFIEKESDIKIEGLTKHREKVLMEQQRGKPSQVNVVLPFRERLPAYEFVLDKYSDDIYAFSITNFLHFFDTKTKLKKFVTKAVSPESYAATFKEMILKYFNDSETPLMKQHKVITEQRMKRLQDRERQKKKRSSGLINSFDVDLKEDDEQAGEGNELVVPEFTRGDSPQEKYEQEKDNDESSNDEDDSFDESDNSSNSDGDTRENEGKEKKKTKKEKKERTRNKHNESNERGEDEKQEPEEKREKENDSNDDTKESQSDKKAHQEQSDQHDANEKQSTEETGQNENEEKKDSVKKPEHGEEKKEKKKKERREKKETKNEKEEKDNKKHDKTPKHKK